MGKGQGGKEWVDAPVPSTTLPKGAGSGAGRRGLSAQAQLLPRSSSLGLSEPLQISVSQWLLFRPPSTLALYFLLSPLRLLRRLKAELEKFGGHGPAQTQSAPGDPTDEEEVGSPGRKRGGQGGRQSGRVCPQSPSERGSGETRASQGVTVTEQGSLTPCSGRPAPSSWAPAVRRTWSRRWSWHWRLPKPVGLARCSPNFKAQQEIKAMISIRPSSPGLSLRSRSH